MQEEDQLKKRLDAIESQVFQIRILLLIFMFLCLLGFYYILTNEVKILVGIGILIAAAFLIFEIMTVYHRKKRIDRELKKVMDNLESHEQKQQ